MSRATATAWGLLGAHGALIAFSTAAMVTILAGPPGDWATAEPAATVMRLSFRFAGPAYVVLGALAALAFLAGAVGARRALAVAAVASALALGSELAGTATGLPFGDYAYSGLLGYRILGLVPFPIPISWFYMLVGSLAIVARLRPAADTARVNWRWAMLAGLLMVAWDISMDPAMVSTGHWRWGGGEMFLPLPGWGRAFFTRDVFYGMPLSNWLGWFLTATLIARVMLLLIPPRRVADRIAPSSFPLALYVANGVMPVALCLREGFWWAALLGALAMGVPAGLAWRRSLVDVSTSPPLAQARA